jgi:uncharacterized coiled-coil DUF342 family protein
MTIEAMRFAAAGKIIDDQKGLIDRLYSERDEARKLAEDERELRQEAVEAAREMSHQIDRHDSKLAEIERERDEARKLAEELRDAWRDIARVQQYADMRKLALPWEEK